jgi:hypothetical protein
MEEDIYQADLDKAIALLKSLLIKQTPGDAITWLENKEKQINEDKSNAIFFMTFSAISSYFGKVNLKLGKNEIEQAHAIRKYWTINRWSSAQAARAYLILNFARHRLTYFTDAMNKLISSADLQELIAIYQALPLFPYPGKFLLHATNGIRSNILSVFDSIALNNPYPSDYFDQIAWNQLVLKTLFVDSAAQEIIGLKRRANPDLSRALINTARERLAAHRPIKSELWYLVGLSADKEVWPLLKNLFEENDAVLRQGVLLACHHSSLPEAKKFLSEQNDHEKDIQDELKKLRSFDENLVE